MPARTAFQLRGRCRSMKARHHAGRGRSTAPVRAADAGVRSRDTTFGRSGLKARNHDDLSSIDGTGWTLQSPKGNLQGTISAPFRLLQTTLCTASHDTISWIGPRE